MAHNYPTISLRIPPLLGLFHTFEGGVSLASEIFLRASPSENLEIHPKIGACGGLLFNSPYRYKVQVVESKKISIKKVGNIMKISINFLEK